MRRHGAWRHARRRRPRRRRQCHAEKEIMTLLPRDTRDIVRVKKISHATYETPDLEGQIAYYTDVLGLTLTAKEKDAAYLASTIDHHSVVLRQGGSGDKGQCVRLGFQ